MDDLAKPGLQSPALSRIMSSNNAGDKIKRAGFDSADLSVRHSAPLTKRSFGGETASSPGCSGGKWVTPNPRF